MFLNVYKIVPKTKTEGPGTRFTIWTQGCSIKCEGCFMKAAQNKDGGTIYSVSDIMSEIEKVKNSIEGITLLGGEPFEQAKPLSFIAKKCQEMGLSVITFTGYTHEKLLALKNDVVLALLNNTDLLIDGKFEKDNLNRTKPLIGSNNQRFIFLTSRYSNKDIEKLKNRFEVRISPNGSIQINGMGNLEKLKHLN